MIKGGYKIVNFNGAALSGVSETLPGIYAQIVDDYDKPVMVSGVSLNGDIMDDAYAGVQEKVAGDLSKSVELTVYGGIITVTEDDEVTFATVKSNVELSEEIDILNNLYNSGKYINTLDVLQSTINNMLNNQTAIVIVSGGVNTYLYGINSSSLVIIRKGNNFASILSTFANGSIGTSFYENNTWSSVIFTGTPYTPV